MYIALASFGTDINNHGPQSLSTLIPLVLFES